MPVHIVEWNKSDSPNTIPTQQPLNQTRRNEWASLLGLSADAIGGWRLSNITDFTKWAV